jgi:hypothetical protein
MAEYTNATARRLAQLLREADAAYNAHKQKSGRPDGAAQERPEWLAGYLLESGKLADLFLSPTHESLKEEATEAG